MPLIALPDRLVDAPDVGLGGARARRLAHLELGLVSFQSHIEWSSVGHLLGSAVWTFFSAAAPPRRPRCRLRRTRRRGEPPRRATVFTWSGPARCFRRRCRCCRGGEAGDGPNEGVGGAGVDAEGAPPGAAGLRGWLRWSRRMPRGRRARSSRPWSFVASPLVITSVARGSGIPSPFRSTAIVILSPSHVHHWSTFPSLVVSRSRRVRLPVRLVEVVPGVDPVLPGRVVLALHELPPARRTRWSRSIAVRSRSPTRGGGRSRRRRSTRRGPVFRRG